MSLAMAPSSISIVIAKMLKKKRHTIKGKNGLEITQAEFAKMINVKKQTYNLWESQFPMNKFDLLPQIFNMTLVEFLDLVKTECQKEVQTPYVRIDVASNKYSTGAI